MLAQAIVEQIRLLLREGTLSQRKIAKRLGVSRGTVNAIAQGKRTDYPGGPDALGDFVPAAGPPRRCPSCGGMVFMPCLLCHVRSMRAAGNRSRCGRRALIDLRQVDRNAVGLVAKTHEDLKNDRVTHSPNRAVAEHGVEARGVGTAECGG
jgi:hypothetical protein